MSRVSSSALGLPLSRPPGHDVWRVDGRRSTRIRVYVSVPARRHAIMTSFGARDHDLDHKGHRGGRCTPAPGGRKHVRARRLQRQSTVGPEEIRETSREWLPSNMYRPESSPTRMTVASEVDATRHLTGEACEVPFRRGRCGRVRRSRRSLRGCREDRFALRSPDIGDRVHGRDAPPNRSILPIRNRAR